MDYRLIVIALGVVLGGTSAGYALGGFATGGHGVREADSREAWWHEEATAQGSQPIPAPADEAAPANVAAPERYVCHGCGPTLAERRQQQMWGPASTDTAYADVPQADGEETHLY